MLKLIACYVAECDGCAAGLRHDYTPHFDHPNEASDHLDACDWSEVGEQHFCLDCQNKPHTFTPDEHYPDSCAICTNPADDHTPGGTA